jgi:hypothetical protein
MMETGFRISPAIFPVKVIAAAAIEVVLIKALRSILFLVIAVFLIEILNYTISHGFASNIILLLLPGLLTSNKKGAPETAPTVFLIVILFRMNCLYRAYVCTGTTVSANIRINLIDVSL